MLFGIDAQKMEKLEDEILILKQSEENLKSKVKGLSTTIESLEKEIQGYKQHQYSVISECGVLD